MSVRVGLVTDVHRGPDSTYVRGSAALPLFEEALKALESSAPDLLIDLGDRINATDPEQAALAQAEVAERYRHVSVPKAFLRGNDDRTPRGEQEALFGVPLGSRCLTLGGWQLLFLDTFDGSGEGALSADTLGWLEHTLAESPLPAIIFSHQPLDGEPLPGNPFFGGPSAYQAHPRGHGAARRIMERSGRVRLAVSGHAHWNHQVTVGGIHYLTLDALVPLAGSPEDAGNYGLLTLADEFVRLEVFGRSPWMVHINVSESLT